MRHVRGKGVVTERRATLADGFLRHATEPNAVLGAYADGELLRPYVERLI